MKALAIVALVFASLSLIIPIVGKDVALLCSLFAMISFRSQPTLAGISFGINIINTAFLTPSLLLADAYYSGELGEALDLDLVDMDLETSPGELYLIYVGFHVVLLVVAVIWRLIRGPINNSTG